MPQISHSSFASGSKSAERCDYTIFWKLLFSAKVRTYGSDASYACGASQGSEMDSHKYDIYWASLILRGLKMWNFLISILSLFFSLLLLIHCSGLVVSTLYVYNFQNFVWMNVPKYNFELLSWPHHRGFSCVSWSLMNLVDSFRTLHIWIVVFVDRCLLNTNILFFLLRISSHTFFKFSFPSLFRECLIHNKNCDK